MMLRVAMRPGKQRALPDAKELRLLDLVELAKAHVRAKVEHPFRVIQQQFGFQKTRLRDMALPRPQARHPILLFVDADVELHHDVRAGVCEHFSSDPSLIALFDSYDDTPAAPRPDEISGDMTHRIPIGRTDRIRGTKPFS